MDAAGRCAHTRMSLAKMNLKMAKLKGRAIGIAPFLTVCILTALSALFTPSASAGDGLVFSGRGVGIETWRPTVPDARLAKPFAVSFRFRATKVAAGAKDHHWGVDFVDGEGNVGKLFTRGAGVVFDLKTPAGNWLVHGQTAARETSVPISQDAEWATFEMRATDAGFTVRYNGEPATMETRNILPLRSLSLYSYNTAVEIRDFAINPIAAVADEEISNPTFSARFDGSLDAFGHDGCLIVPATNRAAIFSECGVVGKALAFSDDGFGGGQPHLVYPISKAVSSARGGVMAWVRHPSNGGAPIRFLNAADEEIMSLRTTANDDWAIVDVAMEGGKTLAFRRRVGMGDKRHGDWFHLAFTWRPDGVALLFIDGIPFSTASAPGERYQWPVIGNRLGEIAKVRFGKFARGEDRQNVVSDVRVYHRTVSHREVDAAYRRGMPVDLVFNGSVYPADRPVSISPTIAPGGWFRRPAPYEGMELNRATVDLKMSIERCVPVYGDRNDPAKRTAWRREPVQGGVTVIQGLKVDEAQDMGTDAIALPEGEYALVCTVTHRRPDDGGVSRFVRTLCFETVRPLDMTAVPTSRQPWKLGRQVVERIFDRVEDMELRSGDVAMRDAAAGRYLEVGEARDDRVSTVIAFGREHLGKPCVLEVEWPDDRDRIMGLYMHRYTGPKGMECRDRLQCGIQSGGIYPNTGKMQRSRFYFFPSTERMLFEVRTLASRQPAAIRAMRIYRIDELPRLHVRRPAGFRPRTFGLMDEDQTIDNNFNPEHTGRNSAKTTMEIAKYSAYTGMNAFHYALARYWFMLGPVEGSRQTFMYPQNQGELGSVVDMLGKGGIDFFGRIYMRNAPHGKRYRETDCRYLERGWLQQDSEGNLDWGFDKNAVCNIGNPDLQDAAIDYFADFAVRCSTNGMAGVDLDLVGMFGSFTGLRYGYDDYNMAAFERDAGIRLPGDCAVPKLNGGRIDVNRPATPKSAYPRRYAFLVDGSPDVRKAWLEWRAARVTEYVRKLADRLRAANPDFAVYVKIDPLPADAGKCGDFARGMYEEHGVDIPSLLKLPGVKLSVSRRYTFHAWRRFRGLHEGDSLDCLYDMNHPLYSQIRKAYGAWPMAAASGAYFETFTKTLDDVDFRSYFQDQDVKPWGRHFLKEPAFCVGVGDALNFQIGDQPPGTLGAEDETREFCQAYCSLPAVPFTDMGGVTDPIVGRYLNTDEGTYLYVVNMHHTPMTAVISRPVMAEDLSSGRREMRERIALRPYELRSFLADAKDVRFGPLAVEFSQEAKGCYEGCIAEAERTVAAVEKAVGGAEDARMALAAARAAIADGALCEAHRQLHLRPVKDAFDAYADIANLAEQRRDRERRIVRVNCGSLSFTRAGGRLFSPDRQWDGKGYGYVGKAQSVFRETKEIDPKTDSIEVYATETFDVDGYRFRLEPGEYRVRLMFHCGWKPDWRADWWLFDIHANGKAIAAPFDMYRATEGDIRRTVTVEADASVGDDGLLNLTFTHVKGAGRDPRGQASYPSVRFVNAIEIIGK